MLHIVQPIAVILYPLDARKNSIAILLAIEPAALVNASICVDHATASVGLVVAPEALERALVVPHDRPATMPLPRAHTALSIVLLTFL